MSNKPLNFILGENIKTDPKLLEALAESVRQVKLMTPEQVEEMARAQGKSYARAEAGNPDL